MRLLICAGGTGGGVYPALAAVQEIADNPENQILWVGSQDGIERKIVERVGYPFAGIPCAGLHGVGIKALPGNILKMVKGFFAARKILAEFKPDVLFFTGGYVAFPIAIAGLRIPAVLFIPDIEPGLALKILSYSARLITVVTEQTKAYLPKKAQVFVTGYPVRESMIPTDTDGIRKLFGFNEELPILLVYGGSKGARSINRAIMTNLTQITQVCQVLHISGETDWEEVQAFRSSLSDQLTECYCIYPYVHNKWMGAAFAAADLALCRSGASVMGELPTFGLPAILVPYPHAWRYQKTNAEFLSQSGAAVILEDQNLQSDLARTILDLFASSEKLSRLKKEMLRLAKPEAATKIAASITQIGRRK